MGQHLCIAKASLEPKILDSRVEKRGLRPAYALDRDKLTSPVARGISVSLDELRQQLVLFVLKPHDDAVPMLSNAVA